MKRVRSLNQESKPPNKDYPWPGGFPGELYHIYIYREREEELIQFFSNLFYKAWKQSQTRELQ